MSKLAKAPRALKEPECCSSSSLRTMELPSRPKSLPWTSTVGVRRICLRIRLSARVIASRSMVRQFILVLEASSQLLLMLDVQFPRRFHEQDWRRSRRAGSECPSGKPAASLNHALQNGRAFLCAARAPTYDQQQCETCEGKGRHRRSRREGTLFFVAQVHERGVNGINRNLDARVSRKRNVGSMVNKALIERAARGHRSQANPQITGAGGHGDKTPEQGEAVAGGHAGGRFVLLGGMGGEQGEGDGSQRALAVGLGAALNINMQILLLLGHYRLGRAMHLLLITGGELHLAEGKTQSAIPAPFPRGLGLGYLAEQHSVLRYLDLIFIVEQRLGDEGFHFCAAHRIFGIEGGQQLGAYNGRMLEAVACFGGGLRGRSRRRFRKRNGERLRQGQGVLQSLVHILGVKRKLGKDEALGAVPFAQAGKTGDGGLLPGHGIGEHAPRQRGRMQAGRSGIKADHTNAARTGAGLKGYSGAVRQQERCEPQSGLVWRRKIGVLQCLQMNFARRPADLNDVSFHGRARR